MSQVQDQKKDIENDLPLIDGKPVIVVDTAAPHETTSVMIQKLGLEKERPEAVVLLLGGETSALSDDLQQRLFQLFSRGFARAVYRNHTHAPGGDAGASTPRNHAVITDGGSNSEVITAVGEALAGRASNALFLGVADEDQVTWPGRTGSSGQNGRTLIDPHYTHVVLVKGTSPGGEVGNMFELAEELSRGAPILTVLVNGGAVGSAARNAVLRSVRREWPILIIAGSGNFADEIQSEWQKKQLYRNMLANWKKSGSIPPQPSPPFISDPVLAEVIADGDLHFFSIQGTPENLELFMNLRLGATTLLKEAQAQRQLYKMNARRHWRTFQWQQGLILLLGVFITALSAFLSFYKQTRLNWTLPLSIGSFKGSVEDVLYVILLVVPVGVAILISIANRFDDGNKWLQMRAASEAIEREMFRYRTRTGNYSDTQIGANGNRETPLANMLETITRQWIEGKTDFGTLYPVPAKSLVDQLTQLFNRFRVRDRDKVPAKPPVDQLTQPGNSPPKTTGKEKPETNTSVYLPPNRYVTVRLDKKLDEFKKKMPKLAREFAVGQLIILIIGGSATLLAALHVELFITVTTAFATALAAYLSYKQVANSLKQYNHVFLSLTNIKNWWIAVGEAQTDQDNIEKLVEFVETTLQSEQAGWIQQAQTVLTELRSQQAKQGTNPAVTEPVTPGNPPAVADNANQTEQGDHQPESSANGLSDPTLGAGTEEGGPQ